jgi:hypothetical protein
MFVRFWREREKKINLKGQINIMSELSLKNILVTLILIFLWV